VILIDSSGWIDIFTEGPRYERYLEWAERDEEIIVPTIVIYEVYKIIRRQRPEAEADLAASRLREYTVIPLDDTIALEAADYNLRLGLGMADAIVYATAQHHDATLVTGDSDFADVAGVEYIARGD